MENIKEIMKANLVEKMVENGVEMEDKAVEQVLQTLANQKVLEVKKFKNLEGFCPGCEDGCFASFIVNGFILFVHKSTQTMSKYWEEYRQHLKDNDLYDYEFSYEAYLTEKDLADELEATVEVNRYDVGIEKVGKLYISMKKRQETISQELANLNQAIPVLEEAVKDVLPS